MLTKTEATPGCLLFTVDMLTKTEATLSHLLITVNIMFSKIEATLGCLLFTVDSFNQERGNTRPSVGHCRYVNQDRGNTGCLLITVNIMLSKTKATLGRLLFTVTSA